MLKLESISGKWNYRLLRDERSVFEVSYKEGWFSRNARSSVNGQEIEIRSKSMWQNKFDIIKDKKKCGEIRSKWDGGIVIKLKRADGKGFDEFTLKLKGFFARSYELRSSKGELILTFKTKFNWKTFRYNYQVQEVDHHYPDEAVDELLVYSGYGVNLSAMNSGVG